MMMVKNVFVLTLLMVLFATQANAHKSHGSHEAPNPLFKKDWKMLVSIHTDSVQDTFRRVSELDIDIAGVDHTNKIVDVLASDLDYDTLTREKMNLTISEVKGVTRGPDEEYKNPEEIALLVEEFADRFPNITKRVSIGKSLEGRDIWAIKISDNPELDEVTESAVLFNSMHHAREIMTPEVSLDIIETLLNGYGADSKITKWIDSYQIWVIPMFNVDGNNKMWTHDKWWRKNTRGGYGVDLNRNYPTGWNKCNGSSGSRRSQTYRGPNPASEPETQAMMNFIANVRPVFDISYHAYSELVIYPFGCSPERTGTKEVVETIGKKVGSLLNYKSGTAWELLYNADGGDIDWMYDAYQVIPFVIELNSRREGFHPSYSKWRDKTVKRNRVGWQYLLERMEQSGVRGQFVMNNIAVSEYTLNVYKIGKQKEKFQKYLGHKNGVYHVVLNPGKFELEFVVDGKIVKKEQVEIGNSLKSLDIRL